MSDLRGRAGVNKAGPNEIRNLETTEQSCVVTLERHYTPEEIAGLWKLSADTVRRLFEREPGVLVIERAISRARRYRTLRIPESVAQRVHRRMSRP